MRWGSAGLLTSNRLSWVPVVRSILGGVLADTEQQAVADRVQVRRVAGDLQLALAAKDFGIGQVEHVERVGLAERDDVRPCPR